MHGVLDTVEPPLLRQLVDSLLTFVTPGGRLVLSQYSPVRTVRGVVESLGPVVEGEGGNGIGVWLRKPE